MRCERCKTSELSLVTFGVLDCPTCGHVDADGNLVGPKSGDDTGPQTFDTVQSPFAAPPPAGAPAPPFVAVSPVGREMPQIFLVTMAVSALADVGAAVVSRNLVGMVVRTLFYAALLSGKPWARSVSMVGAGLAMALCMLVAAVLPGASVAMKILMTVLIVVNAWWLYVLLRPDTVAYFSRAR